MRNIFKSVLIYIINILSVEHNNNNNTFVVMIKITLYIYKYIYIYISFFLYITNKRISNIVNNYVSFKLTF